jgi:hypothetical protein
MAEQCFSLSRRWFERKDSPLRADAPRSKECVETVVRPNIQYRHTGLKEPVDEGEFSVLKLAFADGPANVIVTGYPPRPERQSNKPRHARDGFPEA